jgi:TonB family protein
MAEPWGAFEGLTVNGEFPLRQFLGGTDHSAVFLTEQPAPEPRKAAIKLISCDPHNAELDLSRWSRAANLQHPNLIRIFQTGRCELAGRGFLFILMEHAEESLAQILPERPLAAHEARAMLPPVLDALACLHRQGFVHGRLKPSNVMASGDQVKLSSDGVSRTGEPRGGRDMHSPYDPPEGISAKSTPAGDVWALGIILVEALTQRSPVSSTVGHAEPSIADNLPVPFLEIARNSLHRDPRRRWTIAQISARLEPVARFVPPPPQKTMPDAPPPQPRAARPSPRYLKPVLGVSLLLVVLVAIPWMLSRHSEPDSGAPSPAEARKQSPSPVSSPSKSQPRPQAKPAFQVAQKPAPRLSTEAAAPAAGKPQTSATSPAAPASLRTQPDATGRSSTRAHGEVLQKVLPQVSQKALDTIQGKVRLSVRVHVDPAGEVSAAELDAPGPSKYFSDLALTAARRWKFLTPVVDGRDAPSVWLLRFDFKPSGVVVTPAQSSP